MMYNIYAGLGGGFGGANYIGTMDCKSLEDAYALAREYAIEEYVTLILEWVVSQTEATSMTIQKISVSMKIGM